MVSINRTDPDPMPWKTRRFMVDHEIAHARTAAGLPPEIPAEQEDTYEWIAMRCVLDMPADRSGFMHDLKVLSCALRDLGPKAIPTLVLWHAADTTDR